MVAFGVNYAQIVYLKYSKGNSVCARVLCVRACACVLRVRGPPLNVTSQWFFGLIRLLLAAVSSLYCKGNSESEEEGGSICQKFSRLGTHPESRQS